MWSGPGGSSMISSEWLVGLYFGCFCMVVWINMGIRGRCLGRRKGWRRVGWYSAGLDAMVVIV